MIELGGLLALIVGEIFLELTGMSAYLLLLFPPFLFLRRHRLKTILLGAAVSSFLCETIHGLYSGSLTLGVGLAILFFHLTVEVLDWDQPVLQYVGLFAYLTVVAGLRVFLSYMTVDLLFVPLNMAWILTYLMGCTYLISRTFFFSDDTRQALST